MRYCAIFLLLLAATSSRAGQGLESLSPEDKAALSELIVNAYRDPRVIEAVERGNAEKRSLSLNFAVDANDYEIGGSTLVSADQDALTATSQAAVASARPEAPAPKAKYTHFGVLVDAGVPDVVGASIVYRPWKWLRVHGGATFNGIAAGLRAGVTLLPPFFFGILPTATVEAGHYFEGDANKLASSDQPSPWLRRVNYDYVNGHLGLELGSQNRFVFYIHGGLSYVRGTVHDFQGKLNETTASDTSTESDVKITAKDPVVTLLAPSGKIGLILYFF